MNATPTGPRRPVLLWFAVVSGVLMAMLDQTIVGTALPRIVEDLGGSSWYVWAFTAYLVPATVCLPVAARLSDRHGRQRVLLSGMTLFILGSVVCAIAGSMPTLTAGRAVQGAGAAALEAISFIVVNELSRTGRSGGGQAALSAVMGFSFIAGPLIGGLLTDHAGWRWAFLVNVPVGLLAMAALLVALPAAFGRSEARGTPLDLRGIATLTASVGLLLVGINRHQELGTWAAATTGGAAVLGVAGLGVFLAVERAAVAPVIPVRILLDRVTGRLLLAGAFATAGMYACVLLVPRWYQLDQGSSATASGVRIYPLLLGVLIAVNVGAVAVARRGDVCGPLLVSGAVVLVGAGLFVTLDAGSPGWLPLLSMAVLGLGMGPALSGLQVAIGRATAPADLGAAMGTLLMGRQVIGVIALAVGEALFRGRIAEHGPAAATGWSVAWIAGAGAVVAAVGLVGLRDRLPEQPPMTAASRTPGVSSAPNSAESGQTRRTSTSLPSSAIEA